MFKTEKSVENNNGKTIQDSQKINDKDKKTNTFSKASFVFSILGFYPLFILGWILGLIFGAIAKNEIKSEPNKYNKKSINLAKAGVIISAVGMIFLFLLISIALGGI
jgi:hypothetical protein